MLGPVEIENEGKLGDIDPIAQQHAELLMRYERWMIEIEWIDEADPLQRFTRFGTDTSRMICPVEFRKPL